MKLLVTGGTGFLGKRLIPYLINGGHAVFALTRSRKDEAALRELGAMPVIGDLQDPASLELPPVEAVIHAAAYFRFAGPLEPYLTINVEGTRALLTAAKVAGAGTFVHISAAGVIMDDRGSPTKGADESARTYPDSFSGYVASKARAEKLVLAANSSGFRTIALRPPALWGPGDKFSAELPQALAAGRFFLRSRRLSLFDMPCRKPH